MTQTFNAIRDYISPEQCQGSANLKSINSKPLKQKELPFEMATLEVVMECGKENLKVKVGIVNTTSGWRIYKVLKKEF